MDAQQLGSVRDMAIIAELLPYLRAELTKLDKALENKAFSDLTSGKLTPERAIEAWIEKASYAKLLKKMEQKVKMGQSLAAQSQNDLEIPD